MLQRIVLHLARSREFPQGSAQHGYEITAPLDATDHLDAVEWAAMRGRCAVRRFWRGEAEQHGLLVHRRGGAEGATWVIDYDRARTDDDEMGYRLGAHSFRLGDYVSIGDGEGDLHTFRVADVQPVEAEMEDA